MLLEIPPACLAELAAERAMYNRAEDETSAGASRFKGQFVLIKDDQYNTALPNKLPDGTAIPFAPMRWDKEAKRSDGTWDIDRVIRSTRFECPHCGGHIVDSHRLWLDKHGMWIPTRHGEPGHYGYQNSSFYSPMLRDEYGTIDRPSTWGGMAAKFLEKLDAGLIGGWINSDLAEVNANQQNTTRVELTSTSIAQPDWIPLLTADYHKNHPYLWFIVRKWCAFKLTDPVTITGGLPDFVGALNEPGNEEPKATCQKLVTTPGRAVQWPPVASPEWHVVAELLRFNSNDPATGHSPLIDFLLAQNITGANLVKFFRETAAGDTMEFRRQILLALHRQIGGDEKKFRAPRGGDSELIAGGYCDRSGEYAWDELTEIIAEFKIGQGLQIPARAVFIDCGFAENKNRIVLQKCHESATAFDWYDPTIKTKEPIFTAMGAPYRQSHGWNGWQAIRGKPTFQSQGSALGRDLGKHVEDPYFGTPKGGTSVVDILEIPTALFWLRKDDIRKKRTRQIASVSPTVSWFPKRYLPDGTRTTESNYRLQDYETQSNMMIYDEDKRVIRSRVGTGGAQSRRHPDHPDDCETYQIAAATHLEFFQNESGTKPK